MAVILFSNESHLVLDGSVNHNARIVPSAQYVNSKEGSVVRMDVLTPSSREQRIGNEKIKVSVKFMHTAYWLEPDEAIALADALKAAATIVKYQDHSDVMLFEEIRLQGFLNGK